MKSELKILLLPKRPKKKASDWTRRLSRAGLDCEVSATGNSGEYSFALLDGTGLERAEVIDCLAGVGGDLPVLVTAENARAADVAAWLRAGAADFADAVDDGALVRAIRDLIERNCVERSYLDRVCRLVSEVSHGFLNCRTEELDRLIEETLARSAAQVGADRCLLMLFGRSDFVVEEYHEWLSPGIKSLKKELEGLDLRSHPEQVERLRRESAIVLTDFDGCSGEARKDLWFLERSGARSVLVLPLNSAVGLSGFLVFQCLRRIGYWGDSDIHVLRLLGEIILGALDRHRSHDQLQRDRDIRLNLIEASPAFIVMLDPDGRLKMVSRSLLDAAGYRMTEVIGRNFMNFLLPGSEERECAVAVFARTIAEGEYGAVDILARDGRRIAVNWKSRALRDAEGQVSSVCAVGIDVTEQQRMERILAESEARYRTMFEHSGTAVALLADDTTITLVNSLFEEIAGCPRTDVEGRMSLLDFIPDRDERELIHGYHRMRRLPGGKAPSQYEFVFRGCNGRMRNMVMNVAMLPGEDISICSMLDITERKMMEKALRDSERRYRRIFRNSPASLWEEDVSALLAELAVLREQGVTNIREYMRTHPEFVERAQSLIRIVDVNEATLKIYGAKSREELLGSLEKVLVPESRVALADQIAGIFEGRGVLEGESFNRTLDGRSINIHFRAALPRPAGPDSMMLVSIVDITPEKLSELELMIGRARLERKLESEVLLGSIASQLNSAEPFSAGMAEVARLLGEKTGEDHVCLFSLMTAGRPSPVVRWDSSGPESSRCLDFRPESGGILLEQLEKKLVFSFSRLLDLESPQRKIFTNSGFRSALLCPVSSTGGVKGFLCLARENEYEWDEEEIRVVRTISDMLANAWEREEHFQARLDAEHRQVEAVRMAEKASRLAAMGALAAGVAHEINQPLTALKVKVDSSLYWMELDQDISPEQYAETLRFVTEQAGRIDETIRHMRSLIRQETGREPSPVDLNEVVRSALSLVDEQIYSHGIRLRKEYAPELPRVLSQSALLEQVVINLVLNAMQSLDRLVRVDKNILVSTVKENSGGCGILISDNGPGIPEDLLDHVFDPFFSTRLGVDGMGLGLSITMNTVTGLGGEISVSNNEDGGCTFRITLPGENKNTGESDENSSR